MAAVYVTPEPLASSEPFAAPESLAPHEPLAACSPSPLTSNVLSFYYCPRLLWSIDCLPLLAPRFALAYEYV